MNIKKFYNYSQFLLLSKNLVEKKDIKVINKFSFVINMILYNVITLSCILTLINNKNSIMNTNTLNLTKVYLNKLVKTTNKMKGGNMSMPSSYFGGDESNSYSETNFVENDHNRVDFEGGIARPQLGGSKGGCNNCSFNKLLLVMAGKIYKEHKVKVSKELKQIMVNNVKTHLYKLVELLKKKSKNNKLSVTKMDLYIKKSVYKKIAC